MSKRIRSLSSALGLALLVVAVLLPSAAAAAKAPAWKINASSQPTYLVPGSSEGHYLLAATNVGSETANGEITITDTLPTGVIPTKATAFSNDPATASLACTPAGQLVTCKSAGPVHAGFTLSVIITVSVAASEGAVLTNEAAISGGGASEAKTQSLTKVSASEPPFDFLPGEEGFRAPLIEEDGSAATEAGSHKTYEAIADLGFPTIEPGGFLTSAGHLRDVTVQFPSGMLANPSATPSRCTEAELTSEDSPGCPESSQVGIVTITTFVLAGLNVDSTPIYNMVPPPGAPASFGFNALGVGIFPHVIASIRTDGDYGASGTTNDILARGLNPILDASVELWGDPASEDHSFIRGNCLFGKAPPCKVDPQPDSFLALPGNCPNEPLHYKAFADSWEQPSEVREASYESADLAGSLTQIKECDSLKFEPTISVKPTTNAIDSPSGLDVDLNQPQDFSLTGRSTAALKDVRVTLPEGLAVNAAQADGLAACSPVQAGMLTAVGETPAHFSSAPSSCPAAAKIGTAEFTSPLLGQYNEKEELQRDPSTGEVIPQPLHGSVYIAQPFQNPFKSLLAIYLTVEDPETGIFATLAGKVEPNPTTGQLTTQFEENPQLPLEDARIHLFGGARSALQTPPACGTYTTKASFTPWSEPESTVPGGDSFATTVAPGGKPCPSTAAAASNAPSFVAGTLSPKAATYSPLVAKLSREDGTQRFSALETTLPPGLSGKLAGVAQCSEAQIAAARSHDEPNEGAQELASPSCPATSQIGTVDVGAGAGPTPFHIQGNLYLAGPYKGAPLSFVAITPAIAGPFDLGTVVVRIAAYLDPVTAQVRAVSDPFPQILQGIPVDVRSVAVNINRPSFTLNPTSCNPLKTTGALTSIFGSVAGISDPFQVGGCSSLAYKPKLSVRLFGPIHRGGHPRFRSVFIARPGDANTARIVFALPRSEFIDQAHFRTICTRVQFAANQCPPGSVYGHVKAFSPLVDYPVEGPIYLRSSSHKLPDVVAALRGPASQPIEIDLDGRVDSVNGGIRTTFETVPDQPVTKAIVTLQGAKKGLFQNSTNICKGTHRATVKLIGQNAKVAELTPKVNADCPKGSKSKKQGSKGRGR